MQYLDYYPPVLKELYEIQLIAKTMDMKLNLSKSNMDHLNRELFIMTAEDIGLEMWEKKLEIAVIDPDNLELRRFNILSRFIGIGVSLISILNTLLGKEMYSLTVNPISLHLKLYILYELFNRGNAINELLETVLPLNITYETRYNGTFTFGSEITDYDEKRGFAIDDGTIGGYIGLDY